MITILILDDEIQFQNKVKQFVDRYAREHNRDISVRTYTSGKGFLNNYKANHADLLVVDIYLGDMNGIEIAKEIRKVDQEVKIVFSTISKDFATEGYKMDAFDYLVKPYEYEEFDEMLNRLLLHSEKEERYIEIRHRRLQVKVPLAAILYTTYSNHYVYIHQADGEVIRTYMPFSEIERKLGIYENFICCYRNCMINMDAIAQVEDLYFTVKNGDKVPINRKLKKEIKQMYADYLFRNYEED